MHNPSRFWDYTLNVWIYLDNAIAMHNSLTNHLQNQRPKPIIPSVRIFILHQARQASIQHNLRHSNRTKRHSIISTTRHRIIIRDRRSSNTLPTPPRDVHDSFSQVFDCDEITRLIPNSAVRGFVDELERDLGGRGGVVVIAEVETAVE